MPVAAALQLFYNFIYATAAYVVPGYHTFKAIEKRGSDDVREWGTYWVVISALYVLQWLVDFLLGWLPLYPVLKLAFVVSLWYPKSKVAAVIYTKVLSPLLSSYEADIDKLVSEAGVKTTDLLGQHSAQIKAQARHWSSKASVALSQVRQKALEKARAASAKGHATDATHGLHTE